MDILASSSAIFCAKGWEEIGKETQHKKPKSDKPRNGEIEDLERAKRRARANVRRVALASSFKYFVTLTFDPARVDSMDPAAVVKAMSIWCDNNVRRKGLAYVLVPELHKSGRVHFHGFFNDALPAVDSGCLKIPGQKRLKKPKTKKERAELISAGAQVVYNLPNWTYGFTTALELVGSYPAAVAYVCKYIGKDAQKIGGRWYYSGGAVQKPVEKYIDIDQADIRNIPGHWERMVPGALVCGVNGWRGVEDDVHEG